MDKRKRAREYFILVLLVVVVGGAIAAFGFYKDEVTSYTRLQAWNLGAVEKGTKQFVEAASKNDGEAILPLLGPESAQLQPVKKNGKLVSFMVPDYGGPVNRTLKGLAPNANGKIQSPKLVLLEGGAVTVQVSYPKHDIVLRWDRLPAGWRIIQINWAGR